MNRILSLCIAVFLFVPPVCAQALYYSGTIRDSVTNKNIESATITLFNSSDSVIGRGISNKKGAYELYTSEKAVKLTINHISYNSATISLSDGNSVTTDVRLSLASIEIDAVTVTGAMVGYDADKITYTVTSKMRERSFSSTELAGQLPGIMYSMRNDDITIDGRNNILLMVDGMERSRAYIKDFSPGRIARIEIIRSPEGRYEHEDIYAIVNYILRKDYTGWDVNLRNFTIVDPASNNGKHRIPNEQPNASFSFDHKKINIYTNVGYGNIHWNYPVSSTRQYVGNYINRSEYVNEKYPNQHLHNEAVNVATGLRYVIHKNHILNFEYRQGFNEAVTTTDYNIEREYDDGREELFSSTSSYKKDENNLVLNLNYRGKVKKVDIFSKFVYNYYSNDSRNNYKSSLTEYNTDYDAYKDYFNGVFDVNFPIGKKISLYVGFSSVFRTYESTNRNTENKFEYIETYGKLYGILSYRLNQKNRFTFTVSGLYDNFDNKISEQTYVNVLPTLRYMYRGSKNTNFNFSYSFGSINPSLYQLNPERTYIDDLLYEIGNKNLRNAWRHNFSAMLMLYNCLIINPSVEFQNHRISSVYSDAGDHVIRSFENIRSTDFLLYIQFYKKLNKSWNIKTSGIYRYYKRNFHDLSNSSSDFTGEINLSYFNEKLKLGSEMAYARAMYKATTLQGYNNRGQDHWDISLSKRVFKNKGNLSVVYSIPLKWGIRDTQLRTVSTSYYKMTERLNLRTYDNLLYFRFHFRFSGGRKFQNIDNKIDLENEARDDRGLR